MDATGKLWVSGALVGKLSSVFTSSNTQHGGQEWTILSFHTTLLHPGMVIVGLPYAFQGQTTMDEITKGSPYGASTMAGGNGCRMPSDNGLAEARNRVSMCVDLDKFHPTASPPNSTCANTFIK